MRSSFSSHFNKNCQSMGRRWIWRRRRLRWCWRNQWTSELFARELEHVIEPQLVIGSQLWRWKQRRGWCEFLYSTRCYSFLDSDRKNLAIEEELIGEGGFMVEAFPKNAEIKINVDGGSGAVVLFNKYNIRSGKNHNKKENKENWWKIAWFESFFFFFSSLAVVYAEGQFCIVI